MSETWLPVALAGFEDLYEVSDLGRVRSASIRRLAGHLSQSEIAARYGPNQTTVSTIIRRKTWGHVE